MKKFFPHKTTLKNHISKDIEVDFNQYGPTLGISGLMTAVVNIIFVEKISINLLQKKSGTQHLFDWFTFRPLQFAGKSYSQIDLKMPSKFTVASTHPYKYNILFSDRYQYSAMNPAIKAVKESWRLKVEREKPVSPEDYKNLFMDFTNGNWFLEIQQELQELSYWEEGEYVTTVIISAKNPQKYFEIKKSFFLKAEDSECLKQNAATIVADLCRQPDPKYNIATVTLQ